MRFPMNQESTDPSELANDPGEPESTGDAALDALMNRPTPGAETDDEEEQGQPAIEGDEADATEDVEPAEDDDPEIDLGDLKLKKSELRAGYMKDADYRQKTAEAAEAKREARAIAERVQQERSHYADRLDVFLGEMQRELIGDQAALAELARTDPAEWVAQNAAVQQKAQRFQQAIQERQAIAGRQTAEQQAQQAEYVSKERDALFTKLPEWKDAKVRETEQTGIAQFLMDNGYTAEDLAGLQDHRAMLLVRMAWKAEVAEKARASAKTKLAQKQPSQVIKPGAAKPAQTNTAYADALAKARRTGKSDDIERALMLKGN